MSEHWLAPVEAALATDDTPLNVFCRDDDVGWDDERLWPLIETVGASGAHLDLAVIPCALAPAPAARLRRQVDAAGGTLHLHQHGYRHENHQREGRKGEFGDARRAADKRADLADGRERLREHLGERLEPVFTPPWNRCDQDTADALNELDFQVLSRDAGAAALDPGGLREVPVTLDWCKFSDGSEAGRQRIATQLSAQIAAGGTLGLMFHHAVMDADDRAAVSALLRTLGASPRTRWRHILSLAAGG